jgi:hypothetical protein
MVRGEGTGLLPSIVCCAIGILSTETNTTRHTHHPCSPFSEARQSSWLAMQSSYSSSLQPIQRRAAEFMVSYAIVILIIPAVFVLECTVNLTREGNN